MKNQLIKTFLLTLLVVGALVGLFFLPRFTIGDTTLRRVNILGDVERRDSLGRIAAEVEADANDGIAPEAVIDSSAVRVARMNYKDNVPEGMVPIEDFADPSGVNREMDKFYEALDHASQRPVRIAYYGDSFVEGDILTADLREMFQQRYGGNGVGFVDIGHVADGFRISVKHSHKGWAEHHANDKKGSGYKGELAGISGNYFLPSGTGVNTLTCSTQYGAAHLAKADVATIYYVAGSNLSLTASIDGGDPRVIHGSANMPAASEPTYDTVYEPTDSTDSTGHPIMRAVKVQREPAGASTSELSGGEIRAERISGPLTSIEMKAHGNGRFFGIALDGKSGVCVDNFSMRSSNGVYLSGIPSATLSQFNKLRPYDLIVLHFGLNVASPKVKDYSAYARQMGEVVDHFRHAFPGASILVVSCSDRGKRGNDGQIHTMPGITELGAYQRRLASDHRVAFWNLYEGMGGDGSIGTMKENKQANLDYTHINRAGGKYVAQILFDVLMNGKKNYDQRMK